MLYQGQLECQVVVCVFAQSFVILGFLTLFTILKYTPLRMLHRRASGPLRPALVPSPTPPAPHITEHFCSAVCLISVKVACAFSFMVSKSMF